jgi:hypothetical protein
MGHITAHYQLRDALIHELLHALCATITTWNLPRGTTRSLLSQLDAALQLIATGEDAGALDTLRDFLSHVDAQQGKKLTDTEAVHLQTAVQRIIAVMSL